MPVQEIDVLKESFLNEIKPLRIYLFGSYADGTNKEDSDLDFYIVVNDETKNIADITTKAYRAIRHKSGYSVDIVVGTASRFEERKEIPSIENEVYRKGVLLYG